MDWLFDESMLSNISSTLSLGSEGTKVKELQTMLIKLGYSCGNTGADGDFGKNTQLALKQFQKDNQLVIDGIYGEKSKAKLIKIYTDTITTEKIAQEVINNKWGKGNIRKEKLTDAGYDYKTIQNKVNELLKIKPVKSTIVSLKTERPQFFNKNIAKTYTTIAKLNMRAGASMSKSVLTIIPKGAKVKCEGYYTKDWYYVKYGNYIGFCSKKWLK